MPIAMSVDVQNPREATGEFTEAAREIASSGRLRERVTDADKFLVLAMHLWPVGLFVVGPLGLLVPLVLWLVRREQSTFADDHGREVMNSQLSAPLLMLATLPTIVGPVVVFVVYLVNAIRGAVAASQGEYFRYPITIRFIGS
jgi:uncharacterized Tic20 family protein